MYYVSRYTKYKIFDYIFPLIIFASVLRLVAYFLTIVYPTNIGVLSIWILSYNISLISIGYLLLFSILTDLDDLRLNRITIILSILYPLIIFLESVFSIRLETLTYVSIGVMVIFFLYILLNSSTYVIKQRFYLAVAYGPKRIDIFLISFFGITIHILSQAIALAVFENGGYAFFPFFASRDALVFVFLTYIIFHFMIPYDYPYSVVISFFMLNVTGYFLYLFGMIISAFIYSLGFIGLISILVGSSLTILGLSTIIYNNLQTFRRKIIREGYKFFR